MENQKQKIDIKEIEDEGCVDYDFEGDIKELEGCYIKSDLKFKNLGEFIEAIGHVNGKITLECDRCLNKFVYNLDFDINETFAKKSLYDEYGQELELSSGQFVTDLDGEDEIDIYDLLYQSVILNLPNKKVCGINCNGDKFLKEENLSDPRLDVFKNIEIQPKNK